MDGIHDEGYGTAVTTFFSSTHNWCDRRCEHCPITEDCSLFRREQGQRWAHEARGVDPDAPETMAADWAASLETVKRLLDEDLAEAGIDLRARPPVAPLVRLDGPRLQAVSLELARLVAKDPAPLRAAVTLLVMKVARIAGLLSRVPLPEDVLATDEDASSWLTDGAPNLFLLELVRRDVAGLLGERGNLEGLSLLTKLDHMLDPLTALFAPYRPVLDAMIREGKAPSPFAFRR